MNPISMSDAPPTSQLDAKIAELEARNAALTAQLAAQQQPQPKKGTKGTKGNPTTWDIHVKKILEEFTKDQVSRLNGLVLQRVKFPTGGASKVLQLSQQIHNSLRKSKKSCPHEVSLASLQAEPDYVVELFHEALLKALLESGLQMALYAVQGLQLFRVFAFDNAERASQLTEMLGELAKELLPSPTHQEVENMTDGQKEWIARQMLPPAERKKRKHGSPTNAPVNSPNNSDNDVVFVRIVTPKSPSVPVVQSDVLKIDLVEEANNDDDNDDKGEPELVKDGSDSSDEDDEADEHTRRVYAFLHKKLNGEHVSQEEHDDLFGRPDEYEDVLNNAGKRGRNE